MYVLMLQCVYCHVLYLTGLVTTLHRTLAATHGTVYHFYIPTLIFPPTHTRQDDHSKYVIW